MIWGFLFLGVVAAYGLWNDVQRSTMRNQMVQTGSGQIAVPRQRDGHYYLTLDINGAAIPFVVDTGATDMVLTRADARRAGLDPDTLNYIGTANITDTNVAATVNGGEMQGSLLGMGYLQRWGRIEITGGELILTR